MGVGDPRRVTGRDQTEVTDVGKVVVVGIERQQIACERGFENVLNPRFREPGGQRVEMGGAGKNQLFVRLFHVVDGDRLADRDGDLLDDL
nr:hypothetical protein [Micromonospora sp. DSM 115978]